jgi:hypothetical protein
MKDLNTGILPSLRPSDFPDDGISYEDWKFNEQRAITELTVSMIQANPQLAKSEPTAVLPSLLSESEDKTDLRRITSADFSPNMRQSMYVEDLNIASNGRRPEGFRRASQEEIDEFATRSSYTFIPEDPRAYYKRLVEMCVKAQKSASTDEEEEESLLAPSKLALLNECAVRWRVHPASRISLLLDVVRQMYDHQEVGIQDINDAFSFADNWDYSSWPVADVPPSLISANWAEISSQPCARHGARDLTS